MIPKSKSFTELPGEIREQLEETLSAQSSIQTVTNETESAEKNPSSIQTVTNTAQKKSARNGQINICVPPEVKTEWKLLFTASNVNITQGIIFAIEHLKNEIENGEAILTVGGVIKKS
jgi:hypothetical protein